MRTMRVLVPVLLLTLAAGCGPKLYKPRGRLVSNGAPYRPGDKEVIHLMFFYADGQPQTQEACPAHFNRQDGTFQVTGKDGRGVAPGKYKVAVQVMKNRRDLLNGAYAVNRTPLECQIPSGGEITLDLKPPAIATAAR